MAEIYQAIIGVMSDIGVIGKEKKNAQQGFKYRGVDDVMNALQPVMVQHGLFVVPEIIDQKVRQTLKHLQIEHLAQRPPYRLSGGEKRSAAIATVLSMEPHLMLFDEPTAFLDPRSKRNFVHLLRIMPAARIVTTHDIDLVSRACNRVLVLKEGRLLADDSPERAFADERLLDEAGL